ncbi:MAG: transporter permease [Clostridia bacterium]|jgi:tripartite ATP-independent transporter DctM subunit|nr:transporter permease [Clostridia bacterium]
MILTIFLGVLVLLFILGFSVPYAIGLTSLVVLIFQRGITEIPFGIISQRMVYGINNFTLLAIPFFLLAGKLMNTGSITKKIFKFANTLVGYLPGGLGHANIVASIIFAGMSGSAVADAAGLGTIEIEAMQDQGFDKEFSAAVTAASSTIGPIIPPSIPLIMYGVMGDVSIAALLLAGIVPGLLMGGVMMVLVAYYSIKRNYPKIPFPKWKEIWHDFKDAFWPLLTPVILIGGILSGIFTPTEASAVAVVYSFILTVFVYKELSVRDLINIFMETIKETAVILFIVAASSLYGYLLVKTQMPQYFMEKLFAVSQNPVIILLLINVFLLVIGCFMETNAAIIILTSIPAIAGTNRNERIAPTKPKNT